MQLSPQRKRRIVCSDNPVSGMVCYELSQTELRSCSAAAESIANVRGKWAKNKASKWAQGMYGSRALTMQIGFTGEIAMWNILSVYFKSIPHYNIQVDYGCKDCDFDWKTPVGAKHEVKTTVASPDGQPNYLRKQAVDNADVFWFMSMQETRSSEVYMRGWCTRDELLDRAVIKQGKGDWFNYVIDTDRLNPLSTFLQLRR